MNKFGDVSLEQAALRHILSGGDTMVALLGLLQPESFTDPTLKQLFQQAQQIYMNFGEVLSLEIALSEVRSKVQDASSLSQEELRVQTLFNGVMTASVISPTYLIAGLRRYKEARTVLEVLEQTFGYFEAGDLEEGLSHFMNTSISVRDRSEELVKRGEYVEGIDDRYEELLDRFEHPERYQGIRTGMSALDEVVIMSGGKLGFVFGETTIGKSWLLQQFVLGGITQLRKILVVTTEMPKYAWERRMDAMSTKIPYDVLLSGDLSPQEWKQWDSAMSRMRTSCYDQGARLYVTYVPLGLTIAWLRRELKTLALQGSGIDLLAVDYADMMEIERGVTTRSASRHEELREIFVGLKGIAGEFDIPVWTISQRTREGYGTEALSLKEIAGAIEKARVADVVLGLTSTEDSGILSLKVLKNREGRANVSIPLAVNFAIGDMRQLEGSVTGYPFTASTDRKSEKSWGKT